MGQNKEQLNKLLVFIDELAKDKDNAWFVKELEKRYSRRIFCQRDMESIGKIEKYLGLDYSLDNCSSTIDYSFINDRTTCIQLVSDNREMMRYRYGLRSHKVEFDEFCRFAHLQAEMLINHYYIITCEDFKKTKKKVLQYNPDAGIQDKFPYIESISYSYKLKACIAELFPSNDDKYWFSNKGQITYNALTYTKDVRNSKSHRGREEDPRAVVFEYEKNAKSSGLPWNDYKRDFDWNVLNNTPKFKMLYESCFKNKHERFKFLKWYVQQPFDEVITALDTLSSGIRNHPKFI